MHIYTNDSVRCKECAMHQSHDSLGPAIVALTGFINDPRQDGRMMAEAGLDLDPAFLPLLVRLGMTGPASVVELAGQAGRDHSTISRQLDRLEAAGLAVRSVSQSDGRVRTSHLTRKGELAVAALTAARRRLLDHVVANWPARDREMLAMLLERFVRDLISAAKAP